MSSQDFLAALKADEDVEYWGMHGEEVMIRCAKRGLVTLLTLAEIAAHTWRALKLMFIGGRRPDNMLHVTRIVGYNSFTRTWNRSKLAELRDRHRGVYALPEYTQGEGGARCQKTARG